MNELRDRLESVARMIVPRVDSFERLASRRDRRRRRRRLGSAVLALAIAGAGSAVAVSAFRGEGPSPRGGQETAGFPSLWPERRAPELQAAQRAVDAGEDQWRLDAQATALRFANDVLGWRTPSLVRSRRTDPDAIVIGISSCGPAPPRAHINPLCATRAATITLRQLGTIGDRGVWSVTSVGTPLLEIPVAPGGEVPSGATYDLPVPLPDGTEVQAGYVYVGDCSAPQAPTNEFVADGRVELRVGALDFGERCDAAEGSGTGSMRGSITSSGPGVLSRPVDGFMYVLLAPGTGVGYDPLIQSPSESVQALAAVAVRFVPAPTTEYDAAAGWSMSYPRDWSANTFREADRVSYTGIAFSNFGAKGGVLDTSFLDRFPNDGVLVQVFQRSGGPLDLPIGRDDVFPLAFPDGFRGLRRGPLRVQELERGVTANGAAYSVQVWLGTSVTQSDRYAVAGVVGSLAFAPLRAGDWLDRSGFGFYVLGGIDDYAVPSVTRFGPEDLPRSVSADQGTTFFLVRTDAGTWAVVTRGSESDPRGCEVAYDGSAEVFRCARRAVWDLEGRVVDGSGSAGSIHPLGILLVRFSLDGRVLVSPNLEMPDTGVDRKLTTG